METFPEGNERVVTPLPESSNKKIKSSLEHIARDTNLQSLRPGRRVRHVLAPRAQGDIRTFKDAIQLFSVTRDSLEGLSALYEEAGIIHGAVAAQHIIINRDGTGTLIDWDIPGIEKYNR